MFVCEVNVKRDASNLLRLEVRDWELGWITLPPFFPVEWRCESDWRLLPDDMCQASVDKGWNTCSAAQLIGVLYVSGVLK